jgi:hypothetical protein
VVQKMYQNSDTPEFIRQQFPSISIGKHEVTIAVVAATSATAAGVSTGPTTEFAATVEMTSGRAFRAPQAKHACTHKTHAGIRALCVQVCVPCGVYDSAAVAAVASALPPLPAVPLPAAAVRGGRDDQPGSLPCGTVRLEGVSDWANMGAACGEPRKRALPRQVASLRRWRHLFPLGGGSLPAAVVKERKQEQRGWVGARLGLPAAG